MKHDCKIDRMLKKTGLRCTEDRHDLLSLFLQDRAWSVPQIAVVYPKKDLSTIYRNVQKFLEACLIRSLHVHTQEEFFERSSTDHHEHKTCPSCHLMSCIPCPVELTEQHVLEIQKLCKSCV